MPEAGRQTISDAAAFGRVAAFVATFLVTPLALSEVAIRTSVSLHRRLVVVAVAASLLIAQKRIPSLRYAAVGAVVGAALYTFAVWLFFRDSQFHLMD